MSDSISNKGSERRRAPRVASDLPLRLGSGAPARLKDISTIGLCCTASEPLPEMAVVRIGLELDGRAHELEGAVVRCDPDGADGHEIAVYFTNVAEPTRGPLETYVETASSGEAVR